MDSADINSDVQNCKTLQVFKKRPQCPAITALFCHSSLISDARPWSGCTMVRLRNAKYFACYMMNNDLDKITDKRPATKKTSAPYPKQWARSSSSSYARNGVFKKTEYTDVPLALILGSKDTKLYFFKQWFFKALDLKCNHRRLNCALRCMLLCRLPQECGLEHQSMQLASQPSISLQIYIPIFLFLLSAPASKPGLVSHA